MFYNYFTFDANFVIKFLVLNSHYEALKFNKHCKWVDNVKYLDVHYRNAIN